jgi:hypothetical protein
MNARASLSAALVALAAWLCLPASIQAQGAEALIEQGLQLRRQHRDQEALERFEQAYQMSRSPRALAQIALAEQALGNFAQAETHLQQALSVQMDSWIASRRGQLQQALTSIQARLGTIELSGGAPGAQVWVNGELRGTLPDVSSLRVRAGSAVVEIRASGYANVQRQVSVSPGGVARESLNMVAAAGPGGPPVVQPPVHGHGVQPGPGVQPVGQPGSFQYQPQRRRVSYEPNWGLFGVGAALFGVPWIATWASTAALSGNDTAIGYSFIPIAGPWLLTLELSFGLEEELFLPLLLVLDGVAQAVGIVLAIIGLASRQQTVEVALGDDPRAPVLALRPLETDIPGAQGLALELTHF